MNIQSIIKTIFSIVILIMISNIILKEISPTFQFSSLIISGIIILAIVWLMKEVFPR